MSPAPDTIDDRDAGAVSCTRCAACCCRLEVLLMGEDDVPAHLTVQDRWGGWVMRRLEDGWCAALDRHSMRCTIYERRPGVCRDYEMAAAIASANARSSSTRSGLRARSTVDDPIGLCLGFAPPHTMRSVQRVCRCTIRPPARQPFRTPRPPAT